MTALFPSRVDPELNARAMAVLEQDKRNEAAALMDGAWTGHPDQNAVAVAQFPAPNQGFLRRPGIDRCPDLRPEPAGEEARAVGRSEASEMFSDKRSSRARLRFVAVRLRTDGALSSRHAVTTRAIPCYRKRLIKH